METTCRIRDIARDYKTSKFVISLELDGNIQSSLDELKDLESLDLSLTKHKKKRSLDANGLCWLMCGKIAQKMKLKSKEEVYRSYIAETGAYEIVPIREDAIERWTMIWNSKGVGWLTEDLGECRNTKGYHNIKSYYGSSAYDTKEMSHLLDLIMADAKALGIETMSPDEIERIKSLWNQS